MDRSDYEVGEKLIKDDMTTAQEIYVDLDYLKYLELGKILSSPQMNENIYQQLYERLAHSDFTKRATDDLSVVFKGIELPDPTTDDDLSVVLSPAFDKAVDEVKELLVQCRESKKMFSSPDKLVITIGASRVPKISQRLLNRLKMEYQQIFETEVVATNKTLKELGSKFDAYFIAQLGPFTEAYLQELDKHDFLDKTVVSRRVLPLAQLPNLADDRDKTEHTFINIELVMVAATKFTYTSPPGCLLS